MKRIIVALLALISLPMIAHAQGAPGSPTFTGTPHGIKVSWTASTSTVAGYNLYRGTVTGGPYTKVNSSLITTLTFLDPNSGLTVSTTYFYVATAVDSSGNESTYSNQASVLTPATFPQNPQAPTGLSGANQ
jgi:hypothetical protein